MRNRKLVLTALLLVAVLCISVGFAEVTDLLDIVGTANVLEQNVSVALDGKIYFANAVARGQHVGDFASVDGQNKDRVNITVESLAVMGNEAIFDMTIKNESDRDVSVKPRVALTEGGNTNPEYFDLSSSWLGQEKTLKAGEEIIYTLTVKLKKTPAELETCNFNIELLVTAIKDDAGSPT